LISYSLIVTQVSLGKLYLITAVELNGLG